MLYRQRNKHQNMYTHLYLCRYVCVTFDIYISRLSRLYIIYIYIYCELYLSLNNSRWVILKPHTISKVKALLVYCSFLSIIDIHTEESRSKGFLYPLNLQRTNKNCRLFGKISVKYVRPVSHNYGPLLLTWTNFNPSMDKQSYIQSNVEWNYMFIPKFQQCNRWSLGMDK